jgi:small subunit ribosomal protein S6e
MPFKINISDKNGKTYKLESESEELIGKELYNKIHGKILSPDLEGYEFEITGASDSSGFTSHKDVLGTGLKRLLLTYGKAMHKRPRREGKKKISNPKPDGLRLRKTVRGRVISQDTAQINMKVVKEGLKKLSEIFPEQGKGKEKKENRATKRAKKKESPKSE